MKEVSYESTLFEIEDALIHNAYTGFEQDYKILHSLLRKHKPNSYFEIGTCIADGLNVACNAIYKYNAQAKVYSLDLDYKTMRLNSKQYPIGENGEDRVGSNAKFPYTQLRGDSMTFDFSKYPCDGYFIDGEHTELNVFTETANILTFCKPIPKILIYHDADMPEVWSGIIKSVGECFDLDYDLFRVTGTRIAYVIRK